MKNKEKSLGIALILFILLSLTESALTFLISLSVNNSVTVKIFTLIFTPIRFLLPIFLFRKAAGYTPFSTPFNTVDRLKKTCSVKDTVLLYVFALSLTVTALNSVGYLTELFLSLSGQTITSVTPVSAFDYVYTFIRSVCIASFFEEMLFRGALLHAFSERRTCTRIFLSALLFALMHGNAFQFFYALASGTVIASFAVVSGSLALAVSLHFGANLITFIFTVLSNTLSPEMYKTVSLTVFIIFAASSVLFAVLYFCRHSKPKKGTFTDFRETPLPKEILIYIVAAAAVSVINVF